MTSRITKALRQAAYRERIGREDAERLTAWKREAREAWCALDLDRARASLLGLVYGYAHAHAYDEGWTYGDMRSLPETTWFWPFFVPGMAGSPDIVFMKHGPVAGGYASIPLEESQP